MKKAALMLIAMAAITSCGHREISANEQLAADEGRAAAEKAAQFAPGSMAQERAVLSIHATEQKILETGDTAAARAYIEAAHEVLDSIL